MTSSVFHNSYVIPLDVAEAAGYLSAVPASPTFYVSGCPHRDGALQTAAHDPQYIPTV